MPDGDERDPALERWYRRAARGEIGERLDRACEQSGLSYRAAHDPSAAHALGQLLADRGR